MLQEDAAIVGRQLGQGDVGERARRLGVLAQLGGFFGGRFERLQQAPRALRSLRADTRPSAHATLTRDFRIALSCSCMSVVPVPRVAGDRRSFGADARRDRVGRGSGVSWAPRRASDGEKAALAPRPRPRARAAAPHGSDSSFASGRSAGHHPHLGSARARHDVHRARSPLPAHHAARLGRRPRIERARLGAALLELDGELETRLAPGAVPLGSLRNHAAARSVPVDQRDELEARSRRHALDVDGRDAGANEHLGARGNIGDDDSGRGTRRRRRARRSRRRPRPPQRFSASTTSAVRPDKKPGSRRSSVTAAERQEGDQREHHVDLAARRSARERVFVRPGRHRLRDHAARRRRRRVEVGLARRVLKRRFVRRPVGRVPRSRAGPELHARHVSQILARRARFCATSST